MAELFPWKGRFTFVDVEIPNIQNDSICAISFFVIENQKIVVDHTELIDPQDIFSAINVSIHHIRPSDVKNKRSFDLFWKDYGKYFSSEYVIVGHNVLSDLSVMKRDLARYGYFMNPGFYLDTMDIVLDEFYKGQIVKGDMKLNHICEKMNIKLNHHDPRSDARACLEIMKNLNQQKPIELEKYYREIVLRPNRPSLLEKKLIETSRKRVNQSLANRNFKPYFLKDETAINYIHPYFDEVNLSDLKHAALEDFNFEKYPKAELERDSISSFVFELKGETPSDSLENARAIILFSIPNTRTFLYFKKRGLKIFHSLQVLDFIEKFESENEKINADIKPALAQILASFNDKDILKSIPLEEAVNLGKDALEKKQYYRMMYYYELAASRRTSNIRIYRQLADFYMRHGLEDRAAKILKRGITVCKKRKKSDRELQKRLARIDELNKEKRLEIVNMDEML